MITQVQVKMLLYFFTRHFLFYVFSCHNAATSSSSSSSREPWWEWVDADFHSELMIINIRGQVLSLSSPVCEAEQERETIHNNWDITHINLKINKYKNTENR